MTVLLDRLEKAAEPEVSYGSGERPRYPALKRAIDSSYRDLLKPVVKLEQTLFTLLPIPDPTKAEPDSFRYLSRHKRIVDQAIDIFLAEMAGPDRSREGFVNGDPEGDTPDGVLQQTSFQTMLVGVERAADVVGARNTVALNRQSPAVRQMLDHAFSRLSVKGEMTLERVRDDVHSLLVSATDAGLSPLATARMLRNEFDSIKGYQWERLARTESAFAAEAGNREQFREFGVTHVKWLLSAGACPICVAYEGKAIPIEDVDDQPPAHPNCLCSTAPLGSNVE